jgi:hypothetical protein
VGTNCSCIMKAIVAFAVVAMVGSGTVFGDSWNTGTTPYIYSTPAGTKVSIGSGASDATCPLRVEGMSTDSGAATYQVFIRNNLTAFGSSPKSGILFSGRMTATPTYTAFGGITAGKENANSGDYASYLYFTTRQNSSALTERMRIASDGKVGIGITAPVFPLDLSSNVTTPFRITGNQNPGLVLANAGMTKFSLGIPTVANNFITGSATNDVCLRADGAGKILFSTSATGLTNDLTISAGKVGIGTTNPTAKFVVAGGSAQFTGEVNPTQGTGVEIGYNAGSSAGDIVVVDRVSGQYKTLQVNALAHKFFIAGAEKATIANNGNVGIGNVNPSYPLSFAAATGNKIALYDAGPSLLYGFGIQSNLLQVFTVDNGGAITFGYGNSTSMTRNVTFMGNGKVGIGNTNPSQMLEVGRADLGNGSSDGQIVVAKTNSSSAMRRFKIGLDASYNFSIGDYGYPGLDVYSPYMTINWQTGTVGIGTTTPDITAKLDVNGIIKCSSVKIGAWTLKAPPDYVFDKSYKLPSLKEVEKHITAKKHLQDIPSAAEMKKNGIDLAEMNMALLKKVEELTLYVIDQDKKIEKLEKEMVKK